MIAKDEHQLTLIYSNEASIGKQTLGYVKSIEDKLLAIDLNKTKVPDTQWVEISEGLKKPMNEILDVSRLDLSTESFDTHDWITVLQKNPDCLQKPIAIKGEKFLQVETPTDILKFFDVDSAGLEKHFNEEKPTTSSTTEDESFI